MSAVFDVGALGANPANDGVFERGALRGVGRNGLARAKVVKAASFDPWNAGGHPDIGERLLALHGGLRGSVLVSAGSLVVVHAASATILATIHGTSYALHCDPASHDAALAAGASSVKTWSDGRTTDLADIHGPNWHWGRWRETEVTWLQATIDRLDDALGDERATPELA